MIWISPFMAALFAFVYSCAVLAESTSNAKSKWNISEGQLYESSDVKREDKHLNEEALDTDILKTDNPITLKVGVITDGNQSSEIQSILSSDLELEKEQLEQNNQTISEIESQGRPQQNVEHKLSKEQIDKNAIIEARLLAENIQRQYNQLRLTLETDDSYSAKLGEDYFGYGMLLREANRNDEAIEAFVNALHIDKINNGIYSLSQRASLIALFEIYFLNGNINKFEDYLERILWVENKNSDAEDIDSFNLLLMVGNFHLDKFLQRPISGLESVQTLLRAKDHLISAVKQYGDKPMDELLMPYGELALISYFEGQMQPDLDKTALIVDKKLKYSKNFNIREWQLALYIDDPFPAGEEVLMEYLKKAYEEENNFHVLRALIALGDLNLLFNRMDGAHKNYNLAWKAAELTNQIEVFTNEFSQPLALPNFHYTADRKPIKPSRPTVLVPLTIKVNKNGRVKGVKKLPKDHEFVKYFSKARRAARHTTFRPKYSDEGVALTNQIKYKIRVNEIMQPAG